MRHLNKAETAVSGINTIHGFDDSAPINTAGATEAFYTRETTGTRVIHAWINGGFVPTGGTAGASLGTWSQSVYQDVCIIQRSAGAFYIVDNTILWVDDTQNTASL